MAESGLADNLSKQGEMMTEMDWFVLLLQIMQVISIFVIGYYLTLYNRAFVFQNKKLSKAAFFQKYTKQRARILTWLALTPQAILVLLYIADRFNALDALFPQLSLSLDNTVIVIFAICTIGLVILNRSFRKATDTDAA